MRLLASVGVFEERENGTFALTPMGELLRTGVPGSMRSSVQLFAGRRRSRIRGRNSSIACKPESRRFAAIRPMPTRSRSIAAMIRSRREVFDEAMATFAPMTAAAIAASYDFSPFR